ncbi:carbohydrate ABC transporter permease [Paenibacillus contaminans]|jgi:ABC-type glycerol-3-phosphate transport system permease component|uniref:Carbohydrate ABC transporter permease n=1 Tax=Paenibacillus contaminans TaxID=450362 RepID=A0A329MBW1_9BACL|nr:carbohydrate ABC transporter permease [Paenibacillus contaminans]RAV16083.1 carbohydrate ABC transporter permease [Paenibacillus contaminans]
MRKTMAAVPHYAVLVILLGLTLFPFYMLIVSSFKYTEQMILNFWGIGFPLHFDNYVSAFKQTGPYILNTIFISSCIVAGVLFISSLAGYSFMRFSYPGKNVLFMLILSLMMVPGFLILIPQFLLVQKLGMLNTYQGQIFPPMAFGASMATFLMRTFFEGLPRSLLEAAETEGAGELQIFWRIVLPLSMPVIATVSIINFLSGWNNYIWPLVSTTGDSVKPVILALSTVTGNMDQGVSVKLAGYIISSIPLLALFMVATKPFISGITSGAVKG